MNNDFDAQPKRHEHELSPTLQTFVRSAAAPLEFEVAQAQQRLLARLPSAADSTLRKARPWWLAIASVAAAVLVLALLPFVSGTSDAFAAIQQRLRSFNSLVMHVSQRHQGAVIQTSTISTNAQGVVRTDVGSEVSVIVDAPRGRLLTLLHTPRHALLSSIPRNAPVKANTADAALSWLSEIRDFKGKATLIPEPRIIAGRSARGWALNVRDVSMELWADADGWPVSMRIAGQMDLEIDYRFEFDQALPPGLMSSDLPIGYVWMEPDQD